MVSLFRALFEPITDHLIRARRYLERQGFRIITKGYRFAGIEVDFIGQDGSVLMLVLVRTRGPAGVGGRHEDDEEIDHESLHQAAEKWIDDHPDVNVKDVRLDVIRLDWYGKARGEPVLRYFPGAIPITMRTSSHA
ncbi:YraN family protein [bacterium]|nr:YraN family protein [bacterium]